MNQLHYQIGERRFEVGRLLSLFDKLTRWQRQRGGAPIYVGEFGVCRAVAPCTLCRDHENRIERGRMAVACLCCQNDLERFAMTLTLLLSSEPATMRGIGLTIFIPCLAQPNRNFALAVHLSHDPERDVRGFRAHGHGLWTISSGIWRTRRPVMELARSMSCPDRWLPATDDESTYLLYALRVGEWRGCHNQMQFDEGI